MKKQAQRNSGAVQSRRRARRSTGAVGPWRALTPQMLTRWARGLRSRVVGLASVVGAVMALATEVHGVVTGWALGPGWSSLEAVADVVGWHVTAVLTAAVGFAATVVGVAAAGLVERACRWVRR